MVPRNGHKITGATILQISTHPPHPFRITLPLLTVLLAMPSNTNTLAAIRDTDWHFAATNHETVIMSPGSAFHRSAVLDYLI